MHGKWSQRLLGHKSRLPLLPSIPSFSKNLVSLSPIAPHPSQSKSGWLREQPNHTNMGVDIVYDDEM